MAISAADVKELREKTGAGMMDCKSALVDADGDMTVAVRKLKERGVAAAAKRSGRTTTEGRVFAHIEADSAALVELASETDFVARNAEFIALGEQLVTRVAAERLATITPDLTASVADAVGKIKENIALRRSHLMAVGVGEHVSKYIHGDGNIGVLVRVTVADAAQAGAAPVKAIAFDLALHVAAYAPVYLSTDDVDPAYLAEQQAIFRKQAEALDKPANVVEGIIKGKLKKHLQEICLLEQAFVKDNSRSIKQVLVDTGKEVGAALAIVEYAYFRVGDEVGDSADAA